MAHTVKVVLLSAAHVKTSQIILIIHRLLGMLRQIVHGNARLDITVTAVVIIVVLGIIALEVPVESNVQPGQMVPVQIMLRLHVVESVKTDIMG